MASPFLVPAAFATVCWLSPPVVADPPPSLLADTNAAADLAHAASEVPAIVPVATRAAGNARMPLYDDACMATKGGCRSPQ